MLKLVWKSDLVIFQWGECISVFLLFPGDRFSKGECAATKGVAESGYFASESAAAAAALRVDNGRKASSPWLWLVHETKIPQEYKL